MHKKKFIAKLPRVTLANAVIQEVASAKLQPFLTQHSVSLFGWRFSCVTRVFSVSSLVTHALSSLKFLNNVALVAHF